MDAQADLALHYLHMPKDTFLHDTAQIMLKYSEHQLQRQHLFPKDIAIKTNLPLYRVLNEQIDM